MHCGKQSPLCPFQALPKLWLQDSLWGHWESVWQHLLASLWLLFRMHSEFPRRRFWSVWLGVKGRRTYTAAKLLKTSSGSGCLSKLRGTKLLMKVYLSSYTERRELSYRWGMELRGGCSKGWGPTRTSKVTSPRFQALIAMLTTHRLSCFTWFNVCLFFAI